MRRLYLLAILLLGLLLTFGAPLAPAASPSAPVAIQLLTFSDWHGQLTAPRRRSRASSRTSQPYARST